MILDVVVSVHVHLKQIALHQRATVGHWTSLHLGVRRAVVSIQLHTVLAHKVALVSLASVLALHVIRPVVFHHVEPRFEHLPTLATGEVGVIVLLLHVVLQSGAA